MTWFLLAIQLLSTLPKLLALAEKAFDDIPDSGAQKKEMVMAAVKAIVEGVLGVSTGGQADLWKKIQMVIEPAIDIMCTFLFPNKEATK